MSKVAVKGNNSGTGVFTLEAPNSNSDRTLNLPDEAGTVLTNVSDIETQVKTATNATGSAPVYACRAWVKTADNSNTSVDGSGNISSVTDNGSGIATFNFTNNMPDTNYCVTTAGSSDPAVYQRHALVRTPLSTSSFTVETDDIGGFFDGARIMAAVFR